MSKKLGLTGVGLAVFVVVLVMVAGTALAGAPGAHSNVINSKHNLVPGGSPCEECHVPHNAQGSFLWKDKPDTGADAAINAQDGGVGSTSSIQSLCYSCHDGGPTDRGMANVFQADGTRENHRTHASSQPKALKAPSSVPVDPTTGRAYSVVDANLVIQTSGTYGPGYDCDRCHDPHETETPGGTPANLPAGRNSDLYFLRYYQMSNGVADTTKPMTQRGGNWCGNCHTNNADKSVNTASKNFNHRTGMHPSTVPADWKWNGVSDFIGTRLFDPTTNSHQVVDGTAADSTMYCESCHAPHGAPREYEDATANYARLNADGTYTYPVPKNEKMYPINTMTRVNDALCVNCHG